MGLGQIMTLANSIIGVSVLAMPFCFKQCGIILSILVLFLSSIMTRLACHFLLKAAVLARRRNYEFLAFHAFGPKGKLMVELCIIGFLFGTCIAFFVVMGDLGPAIISEILGISKSPSIRSSVLIGLALLVVLPLGLLRNVDSLSSLCTATILFYFFLVLKIMSEATTHLLAGDWLQYVHLWRPAGLLQCIPIFAMALSCQTQVFEIYESLPDPSLPKMNEVVRAAVNICTGVYVCMGFFGYVAVCGPSTSMLGEKVLPPPPLTGNILMSFPSSFSMQAIKLFFVASIACSFPLVIFPCRASLHSLLFRRAPHHESGMSSSSAGANSASTASLLPPGSTGSQALERIPERRFRLLTILLVAGSLGVAFALPDIELVLGLVGSSIGTITCLLLPALCFLKVAPSHPYHHSRYGGGKGVTAERLLAQVMIILGTTILILSTYANLHAVDQAHTEEVITPLSVYESGINIPKVPAAVVPAQSGALGKAAVPVAIQPVIPDIEAPKKDVSDNLGESFVIANKKDSNVMKTADGDSENLNADKRQEPPVPVAPDSKVKKKQQEEEDKQKIGNKIVNEELVAKPTEKGLGDSISKPGETLSVKEPLEAHDTVHGDAIKKEEEEVGIEEGAAKREKDRVEEEEKKEKERKEKELLEKLADDRKKQQELINVQMEILKKLEALEGKKVENEVSEGEGRRSKVEENKADASRAKKVEGKPADIPERRNSVKKDESFYVKPVKEIEKGKSRPDIISNSSAKEYKKDVEVKNKLTIQSESGVQPEKSRMVSLEKTDPKMKEKLVSKEKDKSFLKEERRTVNVSSGDLSQMKAAVPMPLLLVGQQNGVLEKKVGKSKDREKREAVIEETIDHVDSHGANKDYLPEKQDEGNGENNPTVVDSVQLNDNSDQNKSEMVSEISQGKLKEEIDLVKGTEDNLPRTKLTKEDTLDIVKDVALSKVDVVAKYAKKSRGNIALNEKTSSISIPCLSGVREKGNYISPTIQIPVRLSNPIDDKSTAENVDCGINVDGVVMESMPLKRDLKFVEEVTDEGKQKNRGLA